LVKSNNVRIPTRLKAYKFIIITALVLHSYQRSLFNETWKIFIFKSVHPIIFVILVCC
jgi:hypothetical protein